MSLWCVILESGIVVIFKLVTSFALMCYFTCCMALASEMNQGDIGLWTDAELAQVMTPANQSVSPGAQIVKISDHFINTPYAANTLVGGPQEAERLVINLSAFDCFTFLDVVESLRRSAVVEDFPEQLKKLRYRNGTVAYAMRRHFFSDWVTGEATAISDVTAVVGQGRAQTVVKQLNRKSDGTRWLPEIPIISRQIAYIPLSAIDAQMLSLLQNGDYVGVYSELAGLDVSHTGLIVKSKDRVMFRHASSRPGVEQVVDEDLITYLQDTPGLVVYRVDP